MKKSALLPQIEIEYATYIGGSVLQQTIDFIRNTIPVMEVYDETNVLEVIGDNYLPQEVFSTEQLLDWLSEYQQKQKAHEICKKAC
jgi:hypothetical protein